MTRSFALAFVVLAACPQGPGDSPWLLEQPQCHFTNGAPCRVFWTGYPDHLLMIELMSAGTTGSFVAPGPGWRRIAMWDKTATDGEKSIGLVSLLDHPQLPTSVQRDVVEFTLAPINYFYRGTITFADFVLEDEHVSFKATIDGEVYVPHSGTQPFTLTYDLSASGPSSGGGADDVVGPF